MTPNYWNDLSASNQSGLPTLSRYCGQLDNTYVGAPSNGYPNTDPTTGCPAPNPSAAGAGQGPVVTLSPEAVTTMTMPAALDPTKFYYDSTTDMLYLQMMQSDLNTQGGSPLGSCTGSHKDAACTSKQHFYPCPANGCPIYTIRVTDNSYTPNSASACAPYDPTTGDTVYNPGVWDVYPTGMDALAYIVPSTAVNNPSIGNTLGSQATNGANVLITPVDSNPVATENYPYNASGTDGAPWCPENLTPLSSPAVRAAQSHLDMDRRTRVHRHRQLQRYAAAIQNAK